ncbi:hypothetical protein NC652_035002 [Populus alba x Populus x berolinensis]|nr:hypothetical protein NC652_035002 [Populus alba x Populus x berolinensis]
MEKLSVGNSQNNQNWGWNRNSDPCISNVNFNGTWKRVDCLKSQNVKKIVLDKFNLTGTFDAASVCTAKFLVFLSLKENNISAFMPKEIGNCGRLRHLYLHNLKSIDISDNNFSGELPADMSRISGLLTFFAENNQLNGEIPDFDFSYLKDFNVANNNFSGPIPDVKDKFGEDSFSGNPELCGKPLSKACPSSKKGSKHSSANRFLIYSGYIILVVKNKPKEETAKVVKKGRVANASKEHSSTSSESKTGGNRSEYSIASTQG